MHFQGSNARRLRQSVRLVGLAAIVLAVIKPGSAAAQSTPRVKIDFVQDSLPNGLHVIYSIDRSTPVVAVEVMYNVGSKHEQPGQTGFAHLFEHVMFKGSKTSPTGSTGRFSRKPADAQALTSTAPHRGIARIISSRSRRISSSSALWLEADRMGTLTQTLTKEKLDNQREVVKNERRQSFDNQPYGSWLEKALGYCTPRITHTSIR